MGNSVRRRISFGSEEMGRESEGRRSSEMEGEIEDRKGREQSPGGQGREERGGVSEEERQPQPGSEEGRREGRRSMPQKEGGGGRGGGRENGGEEVRE